MRLIGSGLVTANRQSSHFPDLDLAGIEVPLAEEDDALPDDDVAALAPGPDLKPIIVLVYTSTVS